jgi:type IV secretion system protein VirD4
VVDPSQGPLLPANPPAGTPGLPSVGAGAGNAYGGAEFMKPPEFKAAGLFDEPGLVFGRVPSGGPFLRYGGDGHAMVVAPQGGGKGVGFVVPNLITYPGSMVVIDPKGENAQQTAKYRREVLKQEVYILDPCAVTGLDSNSFNPLTWLEGSSEIDFMADLIEFSEAVIETGKTQEPYWANCARILFRALVCYLAGHDPEHFNLNKLYGLACLPSPNFKQLMLDMANSQIPNELLRDWVSSSGAWFLGLTDDHQKTHLSTLREAIHWMGNRGAAKVMGTSDFNFRVLKRQKMTVYLCVHPLQLAAYRGWFRLMISQAVKGVFINEGKPDIPVVFMLDEFARAVGRLTAVDDGMVQIRGYGGRFAFVLQGIGQVKSIYPDQQWTVFEESCGLKAYMAARDETAEHVSKRMGQQTTSSVNGSAYSQVARPLKFPQEVAAIGQSGSVIAFVEGMKPVLCDRISSWLDPDIKDHLGKSKMEVTIQGDTVSAPASLFEQVLAERNAAGAADQVAAVSPEERSALLRSSGAGWSDTAPPLTSAVAEAQLLAALSKHYGKTVFKLPDSRYGYVDEADHFIAVG